MWPISFNPLQHPSKPCAPSRTTTSSIIIPRHAPWAHTSKLSGRIHSMNAKTTSATSDSKTQSRNMRGTRNANGEWYAKELPRPDGHGHWEAEDAASEPIAAAKSVPGVSWMTGSGSLRFKSSPAQFEYSRKTFELLAWQGRGRNSVSSNSWGQFPELGFEPSKT